MHLYIISMALTGPLLSLLSLYHFWINGHRSVLPHHKRGRNLSEALEDRVCLHAADGHSSPMSLSGKTSASSQCLYLRSKIRSLAF